MNITTKDTHEHYNLWHPQTLKLKATTGIITNSSHGKNYRHPHKLQLIALTGIITNDTDGHKSLQKHRKV